MSGGQCVQRIGVTVRFMTVLPNAVKFVFHMSTIESHVFNLSMNESWLDTEQLDRFLGLVPDVWMNAVEVQSNGRLAKPQSPHMEGFCEKSILGGGHWAATIQNRNFCFVFTSKQLENNGTFPNVSEFAQSLVTSEVWAMCCLPTDLTDDNREAFGAHGRKHLWNISEVCCS